MIRVVLPYHLQNLARTSREVQISVDGVPTIGSVLDALEKQYPMLRGTIRDQSTGQRRPFIRFFVCGADWSLEAWDVEIPIAIQNGSDVFRVVGAMSGG